MSIMETMEKKDENFIQLINNSKIEIIYEAKPTRTKWTLWLWRDFDLHANDTRNKIEKAINDIHFLSIENSLIFKGDEGRDIKECFDFIQTEINKKFSIWRNNFLISQIEKLSNIPVQEIVKFLTKVISSPENYLNDVASFIEGFDKSAAHLVKEIDNILRNYGNFFNGIQYCDGDIQTTPSKLYLDIKQIKKDFSNELNILLKACLEFNKNTEEIQKEMKKISDKFQKKNDEDMKKLSDEFKKQKDEQQQEIHRLKAQVKDNQSEGQKTGLDYFKDGIEITSSVLNIIGDFINIFKK